MADRTPKYSTEIRRLKVEIMQTELNIEKNGLTIADRQDEIARIEESTEGLKKYLGEQKANLDSLVKEHGEK